MPTFLEQVVWSNFYHLESRIQLFVHQLDKIKPREVTSSLLVEYSAMNYHPPYLINFEYVTEGKSQSHCSI